MSSCFVNPISQHQKKKEKGWRRWRAEVVVCQKPTFTSFPCLLSSVFSFFISLLTTLLLMVLLPTSTFLFTHLLLNISCFFLCLQICLSSTLSSILQVPSPFDLFFFFAFKLTRNNIWVLPCLDSISELQQVEDIKKGDILAIRSLKNLPDAGKHRKFAGAKFMWGNFTMDQ